MLSDEEKKEYEELKSLLYTGTISQYGKRKLIDIIEKQSKEIEELKEKNRQGKMRIVQLENEITARIEDVNKYFTPNDKIKAKIEELKEENKKLTDEYLVQRDLINPDFLKDYINKDKIKAKIEPVLKQLDTKMKEEYNKYGNSREYQDMVDAYNFLQSLLEKE